MDSMIKKVIALAAILSAASGQKVGGVTYHLQSMTTLSTSMYYATYGCPAAYDSDKKRVWLVGGYPYQTSVQYYDVSADAAYLAAGTSGSGNTNYNTNSMIYDSDNKKLWYATYNQMCSFDTSSSIGTCSSSWTIPSYTWGPTLTTNRDYPHILYVVSNYYSFWSFDISLALTNSNPWKAGPSQNYYRYDYPCSSYYDGFVYVHGGSYQTTASERVNVTETTIGAQWSTFGGLPVKTYLSGCVQYDRLVYVMSGEFDYSYTAQIAVYDQKTGKSRKTNVYLNTGRFYFGSAITTETPSYIYVMNGYSYNYYYNAVKSIEKSNSMVLPTPSPTQPPTRHPTKYPTRPPTRHPTKHPTRPPTRHPTRAPVRRPSKAPTGKPTRPPTKKPTTRAPTKKPTRSPTPAPTTLPTRTPSRHPTRSPSLAPTSRPSPFVGHTYEQSFELWIRAWEVSADWFAENPSNKSSVEAATHDAIVATIKQYVSGLPAYWTDLFVIDSKGNPENASDPDADAKEHVTKFKYSWRTDTRQLNKLLSTMLNTSRQIKYASTQSIYYLKQYLGDASIKSYFYNPALDLSGEAKNTNPPTAAPTVFAKFELSSSTSVTSEAWFWIIVVVAVLVLFFGAMILYMRHTSKKDKLRRQQNMMAIQKLASLSGGVPMSPLQAQQQQALTHALWLGVGGGTGGTNTNSNGESGENGGEGGGQHTQLLNNMLASKLKNQQANQASLALGGNNNGGMGMGSAPMGMGMGMGQNPMGMGMGMGMGMNPNMGMGMGMGMNPMAQQFYNPNSIAGDLNNYMFNPAMMGMGMSWQEMAQMVAWQNQMLMAQANGKALNPAMLSTDALNNAGEENLNGGGGENDDPNASNKLEDAMNLNTSENGEKVDQFEE